jgi:hypothetical protein
MPSASAGAFAALRNLVRSGKDLDYCEMCNRELPGEHEHLVDAGSRKFICACSPCAILFEGRGAAKYKRVPRQVTYLQNFQMSDAEWDGLRVPIEMAFFFKSTPHGRIVAQYPSPAGAMESLLSLDTWTDIEQRNPVLKEMADDVMALLVDRLGHRRGNSSAQYYLVPIDECYRLVGIIRGHWHGLSGGVRVWREIDTFFAVLRNRAGLNEENPHA